MLLGHLFNRSGLKYPEVSSMVFPGSTYLLVCSVFMVICYVEFRLHVLPNFFCSPIFCSKMELR